MRLVLGLDTSNYTTSVCAVAADSGTMLADSRRRLTVAQGKQGLRQSEALFLHIQNLPVVMADMAAKLNEARVQPEWVGVGASVRPRPVAASYMPVFLAGQSFAASFASANRLPVVQTTHQEGHLAAAEYFLGPVRSGPFLAVHLSGGTSDVLFAERTRFGYHVETVGSGADLHAGQFVDRIGVALGLPFPAGPALEQLAATAADTSGFRLSASVRLSQLSFSGPCTAALRALDQGINHADLARAVEQCVANSVVKALVQAHQRFPQARRCVVAGGVAANQWIRQQIKYRLFRADRNLEALFAKVEYASDNALGVAAIAQRVLLAE